MKKEHKLLKTFGLMLLAVFFLGGVVLAVITALLVRQPDGFDQLPQTTEKKEEVNTYLTHYLAPNVYNNYQLDEPFEVIVPQKGINGIIAEEKMLGWEWPIEFKAATIEKPSLFFTEDNITLMGKVDLVGLDVVVTVTSKPVIDEDGLLYLNIQSVNAGALDISRLARSITGKIIDSQIDNMEDSYWLEDVKAALLENKPFEPVFPTYDDKYIRLTRSELSAQRLVLFFEPAKREDKPIANKSQ